MEIDEFIMHYRESSDFPSLIRACTSRLSTIRKGICGRKLAVWGCGMCGVACTDVLTEVGFNVSIYADSHFQERTTFMGRDVYSPLMLTPDKYFVIIAISSISGLIFTSVELVNAIRIYKILFLLLCKI